MKVEILYLNWGLQQELKYVVQGKRYIPKVFDTYREAHDWCNKLGYTIVHERAAVYD